MVTKLLLFVLYLTPLGYILSLLKLMDAKQAQGVFVQLRSSQAIEVYVKENPALGDRYHWFVNGAALLTQSIFAIQHYGIDIAMLFVWIASVNGVTNIVCSIFPRFNWNRNKGLPIFVLLMVTLFGIVTTSYIQGLGK